MLSALQPYSLDILLVETEMTAFKRKQHISFVVDIPSSRVPTFFLLEQTHHVAFLLACLYMGKLTTILCQKTIVAPR